MGVSYHMQYIVECSTFITEEAVYQMQKYAHTFLKYISIIQRSFHRYMDAELRDTHIGFGQAGFLEYIYERDGITMYDLAQIGNFDKGTVTKAVQKLEEFAYVTICTDENDRRLKHLHITEQALPLIERIRQARVRWKELLLAGMPQEERSQLYQWLEAMAGRACEASALHNPCCPCPSARTQPDSPHTTE